MKKPAATLALVLGLLTITMVSRSQTPVMIDSRIQEATVYLSGAELRFTETVPLKRGATVIRFRGISPSLVANSIQVMAGGPVNLVSVVTEQEQLPVTAISPKFKMLKDSIERLEGSIVDIDNQVAAYEAEKQMLHQNEHLQAGVSLQDLARAADFFRERTLKINTALTALKGKQKQLNDQLALKKTALDRKSHPFDLKRYTLVVTVNSATDQTLPFTVRYMIEDASWEASYDIVVPEINQPVTLQYKAMVYNGAGLDWENIKLSLSSGDLTLNSTRPYLTTWNLNYTSTGNEGYLNTRATNRTSANTDSTRTQERTVAELNALFALEGRHTITAGDVPYVVGVTAEKLKASYEYLTIPKVENSVFLLAKVTGWENLNLIDGVANVYYGTTYIGESNIDTHLVADTLELSLGRDNQIVVNRTKLEDKGNTQSLGTKRTETFVYEIQLRNNRKAAVSIRVQDQIPVSQEKDITVETTELSNAALDIPSGRLQWIKSLAPGETTQYRIAFTVKYPKNKTVQVRKNRSIRSPRYRH